MKYCLVSRNDVREKTLKGIDTYRRIKRICQKEKNTIMFDVLKLTLGYYRI